MEIKEEQVMKQIGELIHRPWREHIEKKLKEKRDSLCISVLQHVWWDEKVLSENDARKRQINFLNQLIKLPKVEVPITEKILEEQLNKEWDLDVGSMDDLFKTQE